MPRLLVLLATAALCVAAQAQDPTAGKLRLRAVLHDPLRAQAELYVRDGGGAIVPLNLSVEGLTEAQEVTLNEGVLELFKTTTIDEENPLAHIAAKVSIPEKVKRAIVLILPSSKEDGPSYRMMVVDDHPKVFERGQTRVLNLTPLSMAMKAGEHSGKLPPSAMTPIPRVKKRNDLNQAQTSFYLKGKGADDWILVAERPMQFTDTVRNLILIYRMPGSKVPILRTLIDTELR